MKKQYGTLAKHASKGLMGFILLSATNGFGFSTISYNGIPARWENNKSLEIEIDTNFAPHFDENGCDGAGTCVSLSQIVLNSINSWKSVSQTAVNLDKITPRSISKTPSFDGKNQIIMKSSGWSNLPFSPPSSALAVTISTYKDPNTIVDSDIYFNGEYFQWAYINDMGENNRYDIESVLTHELGHFLGFDHTSVSQNEANQAYIDATMFFASRPGETFRRDLAEQDILGVKHLYTNQNFPTPYVNEISPNVAVVNSQHVTLEIFGQDFLPTVAVTIVRNNDQGDLNAKVVAVESDRVLVKVPASTLQSGTYDVVIGNSYNTYTTLQEGLTVQNSNLYGTYDKTQAQSGSKAGCQSSQAGSLLWLLLPLFTFATFRRTQLQ